MTPKPHFRDGQTETRLLIQSFSTYLMSACCVPDPVLDSRDMKTGKIRFLPFQPTGERDKKTGNSCTVLGGLTLVHEKVLREKKAEM